MFNWIDRSDDDGFDYDTDGACDLGDTDDDNDGVFDEVDSDDNNEFICSDDDSDLCDDCSSGTYNLDDDGFDYDSGELVTLVTLMMIMIMFLDEVDSDDNNEFICSDDDNDGCDDCSSGDI